MHKKEEEQILKMIKQDYSTNYISNHLGVSFKSVAHIRRIAEQDKIKRKAERYAQIEQDKLAG